MIAAEYDRLDVSSASRRLSEVIKETGGITEAVKHICPLDYSIMYQLLKAYEKAYPTMSPQECYETEAYINPAPVA